MKVTNVYVHTITLRNETSGAVNMISVFLSSGSAILFLRQFILSNADTFLYLCGAVTITFILIWNFFRYRKKLKLYFWPALLVSGLVCVSMPGFQWLFFVFAGLSLLELHARQPVQVLLSSEHILFRQLFQRKYTWSQVDHIILKDGLLTIDFKNNRLFQKETASCEIEKNEPAFNAWCRLQLPSA